MARPFRRARRARADAASAGETVHDWLVRYGQTEGLREWLWEPLALAALNQDPRRAAAAPFARVLADLSGHQPGDAAVGVPARPLTELYAEPARSFVESQGGRVQTDAPARLVLGATGVDGVECRGEALRCRVVIAAVPWFSLPALFDDHHEQHHALAPLVAAARQTDASPIVTVNFWFDRAVLDAPFIGLPGRTFQWVFQPSTLSIFQSSWRPTPTRAAPRGISSFERGPTPARAAGADALVPPQRGCRAGGPGSHPSAAAALGTPGAAAVGAAPSTRHPGPGTRHPAPGTLDAGPWTRVSLISSGADEVVERSNDELIALARSEMLEAFAEVRDARLVRAISIREKRATFSVAPDQPRRPGTTTGVRGLFLAGDWIDTGLPGTIESAVTSGYWAAEAAIRHLCVKA
jgi:hypothetical protein